MKIYNQKELVSFLKRNQSNNNSSKILLFSNDNLIFDTKCKPSLYVQISIIDICCHNIKELYNGYLEILLSKDFSILRYRIIIYDLKIHIIPFID